MGLDRLANDQTLRYAAALRELYSSERAQRRAAEETLKQLTASYGATVRALAAALEPTRETRALAPRAHLTMPYGLEELAAAL